MATRLPRSSEAIKIIRSQCKDKIKLVLDIGVQYQTTYLLDSCRDLRHVLVEPCHIYYHDIKRNYEGVNYTLVNAAASQEDSTAYLISVANNPNEQEKITHSYVSSSPEGPPSRTVEVKEIRAMKIDTLLKEEDSVAPDSCLVKIDVDGIEEKIMSGISETAHLIGILIVEASLESVAEKISIARQAGFDLFDITDHGYYYSMLTQVELIFISRTLKRSHPRLDPWKATEGRLHPEHWQHV
jgi:FkbM family methyltransferase